jgi:hypothetical protein
MKKYLLIVLTLMTTAIFAQVPEDAIRYSWLGHNGSARYMAIGGTMGSLGGDISTAYVNPAGLGFYKTGEFVFNKNNTSFRDGAMVTEKRNLFNLGTIGVVNGFSYKQDPKRSSSFAFALTQTANFNNRIRYSALNNHSSFSEQFVEEFAASGLSIDEVLNTGSALPYTSAPALYTYLIDTVRNGSTYIVRGMPENILDAGQALRQEVDRTTKGGLYELAFSYADSYNDKVFLGATVGVPIVSYKSNSTFTESDTSASETNLFKKAVFTDDFKTTGVGVNLKLGLIYRPQEYIRLGIALHTPSFMYQSDTRSTTLLNEKEGIDTAREVFVSSDLFSADNSAKNSYIQQTPWKAVISAAYVFREVADVTRQRGFISADVEYVNHRSSRFRVEDEEEPANMAKKSYYKALNNALKDQYKGTFNFRVGGELKFNVIMARLGFAYYGDPYKEKALKANRTMLSGGLGYRHRGFFVDVTYVHQKTKDINFPYRLSDRENTYAQMDQLQGNISATVGIKF